MENIFRKHMNALRNEVQDYLTSYESAKGTRDEAQKAHAQAVEAVKRFSGPETEKYRRELIAGGLKIAQTEAEAAFQQIRKSRFDLLDRAAEIRAQLSSDLEAAGTVNPADVDGNTMRLLESGILKASDFKSLYDGASSPTMKRLIGAAAGKAAKAAENVEDRAALFSIFSASKSIGSEVLEAFDSVIFGLSCATGTPENPRELSPGTMEFWLEETAKSADE